MKSTQSAVFNRTGRQRIFADCIRFRFDKSVLRIEAVSGQGWSDRVNPELLAESVVHFDIRSLLYSRRRSTPMSEGVVDPDWEGLTIDLHPDLLSGGYRVKLQVSVVLPATHANAGKILAKTEELVVLEGERGEGDDDGEDGSLLPTLPDPELAELCRLDITHQGPKLRVLSGLQGLSWRDIATDPLFKYGIISMCVEKVLLHIALTDEQPWMEDWKELPGVKGTEHEIQDEDDTANAYAKALAWAQACASSVATNRDVRGLFMTAWKKERS